MEIRDNEKHWKQDFVWDNLMILRIRDKPGLTYLKAPSLVLNLALIFAQWHAYNPHLHKIKWSGSCYRNLKWTLSWKIIMHTWERPVGKVFWYLGCNGSVFLDSDDVIWTSNCSFPKRLGKCWHKFAGLLLFEVSQVPRIAWQLKQSTDFLWLIFWSIFWS